MWSFLLLGLAQAPSVVLGQESLPQISLLSLPWDPGTAEPSLIPGSAEPCPNPGSAEPSQGQLSRRIAPKTVFLLSLPYKWCRLRLECFLQIWNGCKNKTPPKQGEDWLRPVCCKNCWSWAERRTRSGVQISFYKHTINIVTKKLKKSLKTIHVPATYLSGRPCGK